jgi:DNA repair protein RadB
METPRRLELGCDALDELLGGGVEHGIITNVYGEAGSGKTNVCIQAVVSCIRDGGSVVFVDTEGGFSAERFLQMHPEEDALDRVILYEPTTFDEQQQVFEELPETVAEHTPDLIVVDSLVSLYRLHLNAETAQDINTELSKQFSTLSKLAREHGLPVIVTNQVYSQFDSEENELVGRDVPAYWSKTLLELENVRNGKRKAAVKKHRSRPEGLVTEFYIAQDGLQSAEDDVEENGRMKIF